MNNQNYQNPIQQLQFLLNKITDYIYQVNSIILEMNNIINQFNNPNLNQINTNMNPNFIPLFNNIDNFYNFNINNNPNQFKSKINVVFNIRGCSKEIQFYSGEPLSNINFIIDPDISVHEMLNLFLQRVLKKNEINKYQNDFQFFYDEKRIDFNEQMKVKDYLKGNYVIIVHQSLI